MKTSLAPRATLDFETRSACSLLDCGAWIYSKHPTTQVMCLLARLPHWPTGETLAWHPEMPWLSLDETVRRMGVDEDDGIDAYARLGELWDWIGEGELVEAHNAQFERFIWANQMQPKYGWPAVGHRQWRCSAAKAAAYGLPRSLEGATDALRLPIRKDMEGSKVMKKMAKPRKPRKAEVKTYLTFRTDLGLEPDTPWDVAVAELRRRGQEPPLFWHESPELLDRLIAYCRIDVLAEEAVSERLRDLSDLETEMYLMDQHINEQGFQLDRKAVATARYYIDSISAALNKELVTLTDGRVEKATQRAKMQSWFANNGLFLCDMQGGTLDDAAKRKDLDSQVRRALYVYRSLGRTSTAKYAAMANWADPDDWCVRGSLLYHGAGTGRWTGKGIQPHNFPRGQIKDMVSAWDDLMTLDPGWVESLYGGDVMEVLSWALRGVIIPRAGRELFVADYAAIEARVVLWLADDRRALEVFYRGEDIYCDMAASIYGRHIDKDRDPDERQMGKQAILGLGYQMGAVKFRATLAEKYSIFISEEFAKQIVDAYREKYHRVKRMWYEQERAAIAAVQAPGRVVKCGRVKWRVVRDFLHCRLPSGRTLGYCEPAIIDKPMPWDRTDLRPALTFMGVDAYTKKWCRQDAYGGLLVENITQATARDLMAEAMLRCHQGGKYDVLLSVHDELIAECDHGLGHVKEFEDLMARTPEWAEGCPVKAEGWQGLRYRK